MACGILMVFCSWERFAQVAPTNEKCSYFGAWEQVPNENLEAENVVLQMSGLSPGHFPLNHDSWKKMPFLQFRLSNHHV